MKKKFKVRLRLNFTNYYPKSRITEDLMKFTRYAKHQCPEEDTFRMERCGNDGYYYLYFVKDFMTSLHYFWIKEFFYDKKN